MMDGASDRQLSNIHNFMSGHLAWQSGTYLSVKPCDNNIKKTLQLTKEMILLADQGDAEREDTGCGIIYGIMRDSAFRIKELAEEERRKHKNKGWWK